MKPFGRYNGKNVYKVDLASYVGNKYYKDDLDMYLINGDLIYQNEILGRWDGKMVHEWDPDERTIFYRETITPKKGKPKAEAVVPTYSFEENAVVAQPVSEPVTTMSADDLLAGVYAWNIG